MAEPRQLLDGLDPVSLDELNERAALQRRTDNTYLVPFDRLADLFERLGPGHQILEIGGERLFDYESTYFDTPSLRCFVDHVRDRRPRFKARTRCYLATGDCFFEVKVKREDGETVKRNVEYDPDRRGNIEPGAEELIGEVLAECDVDKPDEPLEQSLVTSFRRATVASREAPERTTFDFAVKLRAVDGPATELERNYAIVETKTPEGRGAWDRAFAEAGIDPTSLSKYRIGAGLLQAEGEDRDYARDVKPAFKRA